MEENIVNGENLTHYESTEQELYKFRKINALSEEEQEKRCLFYDDCSICPMAIHQHLLSTTKHTCVQGMSEREFVLAMDNADCSF